MHDCTHAHAGSTKRHAYDVDSASAIATTAAHDPEFAYSLTGYLQAGYLQAGYLQAGYLPKDYPPEDYLPEDYPPEEQ